MFRYFMMALMLVAFAAPVYAQNMGAGSSSSSSGGSSSKAIKQMRAADAEVSKVKRKSKMGDTF